MSQSTILSNLSGRKKALIIGIGYALTDMQIKNCLNDTRRIRLFIEEKYNFKDIVLLKDNDKDFMPTRARMLREMEALVEGAQPNDSLFFFYSGHGGSIRDKKADEWDLSDETLVPCDTDTEGDILDDEIYDILVRYLPVGCRLTAVIDCCHCGTMLDLPYEYNEFAKPVVPKNPLFSLLHLGTLSKVKSFTNKKKETPKDVVLFSSCKDKELSSPLSVSGDATLGAFTRAFLTALESNPHTTTFQKIMDTTREFIKGTKFKQHPQLSAGISLDVGRVFDM